MESSKDTQLMELAVSTTTTTSYQELLDVQKDLFRNQIEKLQEIVAAQCKLTGINPLSQEMAAGALSIKIGKRPRDLLNPKAVKYMQLVFSMKDAISKRETREISAQFGVTVTQVRDFFTGQRSRVRKFVRLSRERTNRSSACDLMHDGTTSSSNPTLIAEPVPLDTVPPTPTSIDEGPSCSKRPEGLSGVTDSDLHFVESIFGSMRKEESFSGQVKLLRWILQMKNPSVLNWFLNEGGLMILATWLCEAAKEEQSSYLLLILKLLDHLPVSKALPVHMSALLQSVNRLRFYRTSDISHRARILLSKWIGKKLSSKKSNGMKSASDLQAEMLLKQSISEVMGNESWDSKDGNTEEALKLLCDNPHYPRKLDAAQPMNMLITSGDDSNKRKGVLPSHTRERRKIQMVEHPSQRLAARNAPVARSTSATQSRPLSADDIQKAKMRAQFMQNKHGKTVTNSDEKIKPETENKSVSLPTTTSITPLFSKFSDPNEHKEKRKLDDSFTKIASLPETSPVNLEEPPWKKCKRIQIPWRTPPEVKIDEAWSVGDGASSKEVEVQRNRIRREREVVYRTIQEIPSDPREPWDQEMDCDDSLTPKIPIEQLPDIELVETPPDPSNGVVPPVASTSSEAMPTPDFELLAELLKNPDLVFALTSGQNGNLSSDETVKLLDMIKANAAGNLAGNANSMVEVSLPSPTPSSDPVPNGLKPDFSRNPFSRQHGLANGAAYPATGAAYHSQIPATTMLAQPSSQFSQVAVPSLQTSIQLQAHSNPQIHHHSARSNSLNTQHLTAEMMLNHNTASNFNLSSSNTYITSSPTTRADHVNSPMPHSRSVTPPRPLYMQEPAFPNSARARQGFESNYAYQNSRTAHNYNGYAGGSGGGRSSHVERREVEPWSPEDSPSRRHQYLPGRYSNENGYRHGKTMQHNHPGYRDAGNKRWQDRRR